MNKKKNNKQVVMGGMTELDRIKLILNRIEKKLDELLKDKND